MRPKVCALKKLLCRQKLYLGCSLPPEPILALCVFSQYKIQRRQLRAAHINDHYCAASFKYLKAKAADISANTGQGATGGTWCVRFLF